MSTRLTGYSVLEAHRLRFAWTRLVAHRIADQSIDKIHDAWLRSAAAQVGVPYLCLRTVYVFETYHRMWLWRAIENCVAIIQFPIFRMLGLPPPDPSIGICQIRPSAWHRAKNPHLRGSPTTKLSDLRALMDDRKNIYAAALVVSRVLERAKSRPLSPALVARLLSREHFGYPDRRSHQALELVLYLMLLSAEKSEQERRSSDQVAGHAIRSA